MEFTIEFQLLSFSEKKVDQIYLFKLQPINHLFIFFNTVNQIFKLVIKKIVSRTALHGVLHIIFGTIFRHFSRKFAAALGRKEHNLFNIFLTLLYKFIEIYLKYEMKQQYSLDIFIYLTLIYKFIETNLNLF